MDRMNDEDAPLVRHMGSDGALMPVPERRRSRWRMSRADIACLTILGLAASFLMVWEPPRRPVGTTVSEAGDVKLFQFITYDDIDEDKRKNGYTVTHSPRGFVIDGRATLLLGGSIHYPRSTPGMWEDLLRKAKNDGLNHVELYVFWNLHEPTQDAFHYHGRANLTRFYEIAADVGLFLHVRFGPYACAEWNNGGLPWWLDTIPGMNTRSSAAPWKKEMSRFLKHMVDLARPFMADKGGPIFMAQIENEYNEEDDDYVAWCGELVTELDTTIPWVMCNGKAAKNTILACNGDDCVDFANSQTKDRPNDPFMWTENEGWYQQWEHRPRSASESTTLTENFEDRDPEEISYTIARWFAVGGAHHNYYMYHGGNNYGRTSSAGVTTKYADGVNLHSDGLSNEPKRSHLRRLHFVLHECNGVLLANDRQIHQEKPLGTPSQIAYVYGKHGEDQVVFLQNDADGAVDVTYDGTTYHLESKSVHILKNGVLLFDTADVRKSYPHRQQRTYTELVPAADLQWKIWTESGDRRKAVVDKKPLEQLGVTLDESDYLTYETDFSVNDGVQDANGGLTLNFTATDGNGFAVFIDGKFVNEVHRGYAGDTRKNEYSVKLPSWVRASSTSGKSHRLSIVSVGLGLFTLGRMHQKGITGDVTLNGKQSLIGDAQWKMYPGLIGEHLKIYDRKWTDSVPWVPHDRSNTTNPALSWYKTTFELSRPPLAKPVEETTSILLDGLGLTRGRAYLNGHDLGRVWLVKYPNGDYAQRFYHIPPDWLHRDGAHNELVVFDETGGSVRDVRIVLSSMMDGFMDPENEIRAIGAKNPASTKQSVVAASARRTTQVP